MNQSSVPPNKPRPGDDSAVDEQSTSSSSNSTTPSVYHHDNNPPAVSPETKVSDRQINMSPCQTINTIWTCDTLSKAQELLDKVDETQIFTIQNFINGEFVTTGERGGDERIFLDSINPKTAKPYARIPISNAETVQDAVTAASEAFKSWSKTTRAVRSSYLQRIAALVASKRELFAVWESIDQGKTLERARIEVDRAVANFSYFATYILHEETSARMIDGVALTYEHRSPAGPFALISPWNMPLYLLTWKIAPCLAFGCTAVAKPSEITSMTAFLLAEVFRQVQLPSGVINMVFGDGAVTGTALVKSPHIKGISFTGGTATGIQIRKDTAADIYKHLSLELGGKNPTLVFADVDLEKAVRTAATAAFENQGEICLCGSRIYVEESILAQFLAAFTSFVETWLSRERLGAVVSLEHYQKIRSYLQLAQEEDATFELGEVPPSVPSGGYFIKPVVLTNVKRSSRIMTDEIFGPVVTVTPFKTEDEAVGLANDNPNGLASVLLTRDGARMRRVGESLDAGLVWVNCWLVRELGTPFGGMKNSGTGREGGAYSRHVFTNVRTLHLPSI